MIQSKLADTMRQLGYNKGTERSPEDFYITPAQAVKSLLEREQFTGKGWEPACGNGAISKFFPDIFSSDIRTDPDIYGEKGINFLTTDLRRDFIITNPPFKLMLPFARHALECAEKVALLCKIQFLEGKERYRFFQEHPPIRIWIFSNRIDCSPPNYREKGNHSGGMMCFCWFIWERGYKGKPSVDWILCDK